MNERVRYLFERYFNKTASLSEREELRQWLDTHSDDKDVLELIDDSWNWYNGENDGILSEERQSYLLNNILNTSAEITPVYPMHPVRRNRAWGWAAAVALLLVGAGTYHMVQRAPVKKLTAAVTSNDIVPGSNKAVLTLADGSTVALDSADSQVIQQGATAVKQQGGVLRYEAGKGRGEAISYNILTTPRGGQFQVTLPDGTQVWLNAESSLKYPTVFSGKERLVEVNGEAYFEIAKNVHQPFKVQVSNRATIEVLGTAFNVNAYTNENSMNTTLVQGKIKVNEVILRPGQQAQLTDKMKVTSDADIDKVLAWKNGLFNFEGADLQGVMRQLARWYDIEVNYEKDMPEVYFSGEMSRDMSLSGLLKVLETADVHFRIEGRRLTVMP